MAMNSTPEGSPHQTAAQDLRGEGERVGQRRSKAREWLETYEAALRLTAPLLPTTAVMTVALTYLPGLYGAGIVLIGFHANEGLLAAIVGLAFAVILWRLVSLFAYDHVTARASNRYNYQQIRERLDNLKYRINNVCPDGYPTDTLDNGLDKASRHEACAVIIGQMKDIVVRLEGKGMPWVTGLGYIDLWHRIHRAEEELIKLEPLTEVARGAMRDDARLVDSAMPNKDLVLDRMRSAVAVLEAPNSRGYLQYTPDSLGGDIVVTPSIGEGPEQDVENVRMTAERREAEVKKNLLPQAITILAETRYEINRFRDNSLEGIVNVRNRLVGTSVVLGLTTYLLLTTTLATAPPPETILWAAGYFLIGAFIGLFAQARMLWNTASTVDDFGLSSARLIQTPWLAGLGAVGGVVITALLGPQLVPNYGGEDGFDNLRYVFSGQSMNFLLIAAVFGLAPDLLIQRLTREGEKYKADLRSTQTTAGESEGA